MSVEPTHPMLIKELRFRQYPISEYIGYCRRIRSTIMQSASLSTADQKFFRTKFVQEMEPLARICGARFGESNDQSWVRYRDELLTDGEIRAQDENESIYVEMTSGRNDRLLDYAFKEYRANGRIISLTYYTDEDVRYLQSFTDDAVEGELEEDTIKKHTKVLAARIRKKLERNWPSTRRNWLCVVIDDITYWPEDRGLSERIFEPIHRQLHGELGRAGIEELWFVGSDSVCWSKPI